MVHSDNGFNKRKYNASIRQVQRFEIRGKKYCKTKTKIINKSVDLKI
jgi:hypothetical protein